MKKVLSLLTALAMVFVLDAQYYNFTTTTSAYNDLLGATSLTNAQPWTPLIYKYDVPLGFNFKFFDKNCNKVYVTDFVSLDQSGNYFVNALNVTYIWRPGADISYLIDGTKGNCIAKIEWKNVGFYFENLNLGTTNDYINVQLWLYEGTNKVEIYIGPSSVMSPTQSYGGLDGPFIGIWHVISFSPTTCESVVLTGNPTNPTPVFDTPDFSLTLTGTPANGTVYNFTNLTTGFENQYSNDEFSIFPQPAHDILYLSPGLNNNPPTKLVLRNISGKSVIINTVNGQGDNIYQINVSNLPKGIYFIEICTQDKKIHKKILKS